MNSNHLQPDQTIEIDNGHSIITLTSEMFKGKRVFTSYVNNISLRSTSLHIPRVLDNFIDCLNSAAAPTDPDLDGLTEVNEQDIRAFVALHLNGM